MPCLQTQALARALSMLAALLLVSAPALASGHHSSTDNGMAPSGSWKDAPAQNGDWMASPPRHPKPAGAKPAHKAKTKEQKHKNK
jgi:hypothetical protein